MLDTVVRLCSHSKPPPASHFAGSRTWYQARTVPLSLGGHGPCNANVMARRRSLRFRAVCVPAAGA